MRGVNPANVISSGSFTSSKSEIKRRNPVHPLYTRIDIPGIKLCDRAKSDSLSEAYRFI